MAKTAKVLLSVRVKGSKGLGDPAKFLELRFGCFVPALGKLYKVWPPSRKVGLLARKWMGSVAIHIILKGASIYVNLLLNK